ncbi:MAG: 5'-nucleotidase, partial [Clostridiales bacterium]|nr:5'-nucleotidase [Clostridiales bacterium]
MAYPIDKKIVVGISSNALFDLNKEDEIFKEKGLEAYRKYQVDHKNDVLGKGVAFPFIKRFLAINDVYVEEQPIEVILLSRNSPETGVRAFNSKRHNGLDISRAVFMSGGSAIDYIPAFNISLFLTKDEEDVIAALESGEPAG